MVQPLRRMRSRNTPERPLPEAQIRLPAAAMMVSGKVPCSMRMDSMLTVVRGKRSVSVTTMWPDLPMSLMPAQPATEAPARNTRLDSMEKGSGQAMNAAQGAQAQVRAAKMRKKRGHSPVTAAEMSESSREAAMRKGAREE